MKAEMGVTTSAGMALLAAVLTMAPAWGQPVVIQEPAAVPRVSGPAVRVVALEGERVSQGVIAAIGRAQINREGEIAFAATIALGLDRRQGLFAWAGSVLKPLALEEAPTGRGPLLLPDGFGDWAWNDGERAVFLAPVDANGNGRFDPGVDPVFLFLASRGNLTPLVRIGDRVDGGTLLAILSFRLNAAGQVAIQARIDRNGNGRFDPGVDTTGIYLVTEGRIEPLLREGDPVGNGTVRSLDTTEPLRWQLNNRGEVALQAGLELPATTPPVHSAIYGVDHTGIQLLVFSGLQTAFGTLEQLGSAALNDAGDIVFPAALKPGLQPPIVLFRVRTSPPGGPLEGLVGPGTSGPTGTAIGDLFPEITVPKGRAVGFCGFYDQPVLGGEAVIPDPAACFILAPEFLYEVIRQGAPTPWGEIGAFDAFVLNDQGQAAVQAKVETFPFVGAYPLNGAEAILYWENGDRASLVGPGDEIPGGRVGRDTSLTGLSDTGRLAFEATVTDDLAISRRGIFAVEVPGSQP